MDKRAFDVAMRSLLALDPAIQPGPPTAPAAPVKPETLTDKQIADAIETALKSYQQSLILSYLRRLNVPQLFVIFDQMVKSFNDSGEPQKQFEIEFSNLKPKLMTAIGNLILSDKNSIKNKFTREYIKTPPKDTNEVTDDVHAFLSDLRKKAIVNIRHLNQFV